MGTFAYEVTIDGQVCKAHVDHMRPWLANTNDETVIPVTDHDSQTNDAIISPKSDEAASNLSEILVRRARIPTKRLVEEMD